MMTFNDLLALRDAVARSRSAASPAVLATLAAREGHSYRDVNDMMVMTEALELVGGVSGGCLEDYIGRVGRQVLGGRARPSVIMRFDTAVESPDRPTLGCGGQLDILVELAGPWHLAYLDALLAAMQSSDRAAAVLRYTDNGAFPDPSQCRAVLVDGEATFGNAPAMVDQLAEEAVSLRQHLAGRDGESHVAVSYLWPRPRLVIFGARDDAMPLAEMARLASWHVTVADRRERLATAGRFPNVDQLIAAPWPDAVTAIDQPARTYAVVMTHSIEDDAALLPPLMAMDLAYLGLLGPSARTQRLWAALGQDNRHRVRSPVGLALGDKSPAGIAVAIMAELVSLRVGTPADRLPLRG